MQWQIDRKLRLSRGGSPRQADEAAFLEGVVLSDGHADRRDAIQPVKDYNAIAVVVGRKSGSQPGSQFLSQNPAKPLRRKPAAAEPPPQKSPRQKPFWQKPLHQKPLPQKPLPQRPPPQKPPLREPPPLAIARFPARAVTVRETIKGANLPSAETSEPDGFGAYVVRSFEHQRRAGGRVLAFALIVGGGFATLMPLSGAVVVPGTVVSESSIKKIQHQTGGTIASINVTNGTHVHKGDVLIRLDDSQVRANFEVLRNKIAEYNDEIAGMDAQIKSRETQADLIAKELKGVEELWEKRLTPLTRLTSLQRQAAQIDGEKAQLVSSIAETRSKIGDAQLQLVAAKDQMSHIDLRAPVNGIVHDLAVHTIGGVVTPAEVLMDIVPEGDELQVEAHLPPDKIDQVHKEQEARIRFPAFNQRTTPELTGIVSYVSADTTNDQRTGASYYTVRVSLPAKEYARLGNRRLVAGMPAELFIQTTKRTMISYLFKPLSEQLSRMFRER